MWTVVGIALLCVLATLPIICVLKGKYWTALIAILTGAGLVGVIVGLVGAIRAAKPGSWWSKHVDKDDEWFAEERTQPSSSGHA